MILASNQKKNLSRVENHKVHTGSAIMAISWIPTLTDSKNKGRQLFGGRKLNEKDEEGKWVNHFVKGAQ